MPRPCPRDLDGLPFPRPGAGAGPRLVRADAPQLTPMGLRSRRLRAPRGRSRHRYSDLMASPSSGRLGLQPFDLPAVTGAAVDEPVVQAVVVVLPELDLVRDDAVLRPRSRGVRPHVPRARLVPPLSPRELGPVRQRPDRRDARALTSARARARKSRRILRRHAFDRASSTRTCRPSVPVEQELAARELASVRGPAARVARGEHEAALVGALQQHHPRGWAAVRRNRRDTARFGQGNSRRLRLRVPRVELADRVGVEIVRPHALSLEIYFFAPWTCVASFGAKAVTWPAAPRFGAPIMIPIS